MRLLSPKIILLAAGVVVILILFSLTQEMNRRIQIRREIVRLENETRRLEKNLTEMENLNQYFKTDAFAERMAREKLNYQAAGEKVVLIPEGEQVEPTAPTAQAENSKSIPRHWWDAFFSSE